jgi:hypothetical protein
VKDDAARPLSDDERRTLQASADALSDLAYAFLGDDDERSASLAAFVQAASQLDLQRIVDCLHLPEDAGEWAGGLERILHRIPAGCGRWIDCGPGWYPILVGLDLRLAELAPGYEVYQVKEKFGTLRYDCDPCFEPLAAPADNEPTYPGSSADPARLAAWEDALAAWEERRRRWLATADGQRAQVLREERQARFNELVREAELLSARTCELCGEPGKLRRSADGWRKTLCARCASGAGFGPPRRGERRG